MDLPRLSPEEPAVLLGLLADIHEAVEPLTAAVRALKARRVDAFVMLGDVLDAGERVDETVAILARLPGPAVWGNHDFGLCGELHPSIRPRFSSATLDYFARLRPWAELGGCVFHHVDPHLDPGQLADLWSFPSAEDRIAGLARSSHARAFVGHLHRWALFTPERQLEWEGGEVLRYRANERYLTVVHAVINGWCATLDTELDVLEPVQLPMSQERNKGRLPG